MLTAREPVTDLDRPAYYRADLLTMRQEPSQDLDAPPVIRLRLEDPQTGERQSLLQMKG
jgi:hypothetical protein